MKSFTALPSGWLAHFKQEDGVYESCPIIGVELNEKTGRWTLLCVDGSGYVEEARGAVNFAGITAPGQDVFLPGSPEDNGRLK